ncbi:MAG TPA: hypothetical protein VE693_00410 [Gaiellaceae bacterium]|nr:hypothetical protein [Gaiellaceae bacterium]
MRLALTLVAALALAGCGERAASSLPVLPKSAVPGLSATTEPVTLESLFADFGTTQSNFEGRIRGFVRGSERVFQGESSRFDRVVSRTLEFDDAEAAREYVDFYRSHLTNVYGPGTTARTLESKGRSGYLVDAASCACHRAEPTLAGVVTKGNRVSYLEVNGGAARAPAVVALLRQAP